MAWNPGATARWVQSGYELRAALGGQVARLHTITGTGFAPPVRVGGSAAGDLAGAAFLDMVNAVLADAETFAVTLPAVRSPDVLEWFDALATALDEVTTPVLVHFDLWDGNILVEPSSAWHRIRRPDRRRASVLGPSAGGIRLAGAVRGHRAGHRVPGRLPGCLAVPQTFDVAARQRLSALPGSPGSDHVGGDRAPGVPPRTRIPDLRQGIPAARRCLGRGVVRARLKPETVPPGDRPGGTAAVSDDGQGRSSTWPTT